MTVSKKSLPGPQKQSAHGGGEAYPARVLRDMAAGVLVIDRKGRIVYLNAPASAMLELPGGTQLSAPVRALSSAGGENDRFIDYILEAVREKDVTHKGTVPFTAASGKQYVFRMSSSYLQSDNAAAEGGPEIVVTFTDETVAEEMRRKYNDSSRCFAIAIFCICIWVLIYALWEMTGRKVSVDLLTHGTEVMGLIMMLFIFRYTSFTTRELGITMDDPKKTVLTGLAVSAAAVGFLALVKFSARLFDPTLFGGSAPFIDFGLFTWRQAAYILTAGIQEFIARSIMQNNIRRISVGKNPAASAIILSSLMFAALHIQHGFLFMAGAAVLGALEGILYEKQQNIFGVWIVHWFFGVAGTLLSLVAISH